jgi:hypothetical protein
MRFLNERKRPAIRARLGVVMGLRTRLLDIHGFGGQYARRASSAKTIRGAMAAVRDFKTDRARQAAEEQAQRDRLEAFAGMKGINEQGQQLDRREFAETQEALRWVATCHMGWYNRRKRYRRDLLEILGDFDRQGLTADHGIVMKVRKDGQAWYAYRRTITGWVLGIGASKGTLDQWFYDGPEPPSSYPRPGHGWGATAHVETVNWQGDVSG